MERFHLYRPPGAGGAFMAAADDGPWVMRTDAQSAIDAANQRATDAERRLALAVAEVRAKRARVNGSADVDHPSLTPEESRRRHVLRATDVFVEQDTNADPVLAKMIEKGGG